MATYGEKLAYQRGYQRAVNGRWPNDDKIPDARYRRLVKAARKLSDAVDHFMAAISLDDRETDPMQVAIDEARDAVLVEIIAAQAEAASVPPAARKDGP